MVTYFNKTDLVKFGKYLLSEERTKLILNNPNFLPKEQIEERIREVCHSDVENFLETIKKE